MKRQLLLAALSVAMLGAAPFAQAKGCLKGAAVGGVAGHVVGHHGLLGAAAGCAIGHHRSKKQQEHAVRPTQQQKG